MTGVQLCDSASASSQPHDLCKNSIFSAVYEQVFYCRIVHIVRLEAYQAYSGFGSGCCARAIVSIIGNRKHGHGTTMKTSTFNPFPLVFPFNVMMYVICSDTYTAAIATEGEREVE